MFVNADCRCPIDLTRALALAFSKNTPTAERLRMTRRKDQQFKLAINMAGAISAVV